jgi:hypothetical protein
MKRALTVFVLATLFACLSAFQGCYARAGGEENAGNATQGGAAPPPTQGGATGAWVQVPGESIGGKWIPPHWAWSPAPNPGQPRPVQYQYTVPAYALVPAPNFGSVFADIIFLRPIGIAGLALGTAAAIVATPFALPSGSMGVVGSTLIEAPYDFTFRRPLGVW